MEEARETQKYRLIAEIKRHPPIYKSDRESKYDKETYDLSWEEVSKQLGMPVSACQRDWAKIKQDYDEHVIKYPNYDNQTLSFSKYLDGSLDFLKPETDDILQSTSNITLTNSNHVIEFKSENDEICSSNEDINPLAEQGESHEKEFNESNNIKETVLVDGNKQFDNKLITGEQHDMLGKSKLRHAKRLRKPKRKLVKQDTSSKHDDSYSKKKVLKSENQHMKFADFVDEQQDVELVSNDSESISSDEASNINSIVVVKNKSHEAINSFETPVLSDSSQKKAADPQLLQVLNGDNCCTKGTAEQQDFSQIMLKPAKQSESDTIQNEELSNKNNSNNIITGKCDLSNKTSGNVLTTHSTDNANGSRSINEGQSSDVMPRKLEESTNITKYPLLNIPVPPLIYFATKTKDKPITTTNTGSKDAVSKEVTSILDVNVEQTDMNIFFDEIAQYISRTYPLEDQIRIRSKICDLVSKAEIEEKQ